MLKVLLLLAIEGHIESLNRQIGKESDPEVKALREKTRAKFQAMRDGIVTDRYTIEDKQLELDSKKK